MLVSQNNNNDLIERLKFAQCERRFLPEMNNNFYKSSEDLFIQNTQYLLSNDPDLICQSINFFKQYVDSIELSTITQIFSLDFQNSFDIQDCINGFIESISKCRKFLENTDFAMLIITFLINFTNIDEKQFVVTSFESISNFINANKNVASYLCSIGFFNLCFSRFCNYTNELSKLENDDTTEITEYFYLIYSLLKVFSSLFIHSDLINYEYSNLVSKCFNYLLKIEVPTNHALELKILVFDNLYWFAISAPDESIQEIFTPDFTEVMLSLLDVNDDVRCSIFESIGKITSHNDKFSLFFIHPPIDLLNRMQNYTNWQNETKHSFLRILRNFAACKDITPSLIMANTPHLTDFLKSVFIDCSFNAQKEAYIVLFYMIMTKKCELIQYVLNNFTDFFPDLLGMLSTEDHYFNEICLYSIYICATFLESKNPDLFNQFLDIFRKDDWIELISEFSSNSDENISKTSTILSNKIYA